MILNGYLFGFCEQNFFGPDFDCRPTGYSQSHWRKMLKEHEQREDREEMS